MITLTTTIQEITLQAYVMHVYNLMQDELNMSRDEIFNTFEAWGHEFEETHEDYEWNGDYYDEIDKFIQRKEKALRAGLTKENKTEWQALLDIANEDLLKKGYSLRITEDENGFYQCDILYHGVDKDGVKYKTYAENYFEEELADLVTDAWHYVSTLCSF